MNDIFDLSQIESGTVDFVYKEFDANDLLRELDGIFMAKLNNSPVELICEAHVQPIMMYSERERIIQVLSNLLHNAMKPRTRFEGQPGIYFQLCVAEGD